MAKELTLRPGESVFADCKGDTWRTPDSILSKQVSGRFYFTDQRIAFRTWGPFKNSVAYDIEFKEIASIAKYTINMIIPTGIKVTLHNGATYKLSVMKRNHYIEYLSQYIG